MSWIIDNQIDRRMGLKLCHIVQFLRTTVFCILPVLLIFPDRPKLKNRITIVEHEHLRLTGRMFFFRTANTLLSLTFIDQTQNRLEKFFLILYNNIQ
jgi:hypothetical protein